MPIARELTYAQLKAKGACANQLALFKAKFGESVIIDVTLCESVASEFDFTWAAKHLLSATAWAEYERVTAAASAKYERARAAASAKYERAMVAAWAEYERVRAAAFAVAFINNTENQL